MTAPNAFAPAPSPVAGPSRYSGARSFEESECGKFFGRNRAAEELLLRVLSVRLLLQFAPSGAGKTSLLNAGLFPRLRPHGYLPFTIRLNSESESLVQATLRSLRDAARTSGLLDPVIPEAPESLWDLLSKAQLWSTDVRLLRPVLVFDQFEEVFTRRDEVFRRQFAEEIGEVLHGRRSPASPNGEPLLTDAKVIISLREEYLGKLEELTGTIPDLFRERLRLPPLTVDEARQAIMEPGRLDGEWRSPRFGFDLACVESLIGFIDGASDKVKIIEPLTLQLVCQCAESIVLARQGKGEAQAAKPLILDDFGGLPGLEGLVHGYYLGELEKVGNRKIRRRVARMFEEGLLDPTGKRLMPEEDQIRRRFDLGAEVLRPLVDDSRLLRREPRNESVFYEIAHDRLADAIAAHRGLRLPGWVRWSLALLTLVIIVLGVAVFLVSSAKETAERARNQTAQTLQVLWGDELVMPMREVGLSDPIQQAVHEAAVDVTSDPLARALRLRRLGEVALERETLAVAEDHFRAALGVLDTKEGAKVSGVASSVERAQILRILAEVFREKGDLEQALARCVEATQLWGTVLEKDGNPSYRLNAAEAYNTLGTIHSLLGESEAEEAAYTRGADEAMQVLVGAYHELPGGDPKTGFRLGRAMQLYADAALGLARTTWAPDELKSARALAMEALILRPLSARARIQVGVASATYGSALAQNGEWQSARRMIAESRQQFRELTRFDPSNRQMLRELTAVQLIAAQGISRCATNAEYRTQIGDGELAAAEASALDATGRLADLASRDPGNQALKSDLSWGLEVQGALALALGDPEPAAALYERALRDRQSTVRNDPDAVGRMQIINLMKSLAELRIQSARWESASNLAAQAEVEIQRLPDRAVGNLLRVELLGVEANLWMAQGRSDLAEARRELARTLGAGADPLRKTRSARALELNREGNDLFQNAGGLNEASEKVGAYERAAEKYQEATRLDLFEPVYWDNLRGAFRQAASALPSAGAEGAPLPRAIGERKERLLRGALANAWIASVVAGGASGDEDKSARLKRRNTVYEERRSLAMFLRDQPEPERVSEALILADLGVREAEAWVEEQTPGVIDTGPLGFLADAHFGLALMRAQSGAEGWEEAFRTAIRYGEQLRAKEPASFDRHLWVGQVRTQLAEGLERNASGATEEAVKDSARMERKLSRKACQDALDRATTDAQKDQARACLDSAGE